MIGFRILGVAFSIAAARAIAAFLSTGDWNFFLGTIMTTGFWGLMTGITSGALFSPVKKDLERTSSKLKFTVLLPLSL